MIKLINNEFIKIKRSKLIFTQIIFIIIIYIMKKVSSNDLLNLSYNLIPFVGIMVCILFGNTISGEIENGTFRFYLTKPFKRWKVYLSKFICINIYIILTLLIIIICTSILSKNYNYDYFIKYIIYSIPVFFIGSFVLYLSSNFKNNSFIVGVSIFILSFSLILSQVLFGLEFNFVEYTFLPYLDFSIFNDKTNLLNMNQELGINLSINKAIIIDFIYLIIFYYLGCKKFMKKDIKN